MNTIAWVTPSYFLDTDLYIMRYLPDFFKIRWYLTKFEGQKFDNERIIEEISRKNNIEVIKYIFSGNIYGLKHFLQLKDFQKTVRKNADLVYQPSGFIYTLPLMMWFGNRDKWVVPIHNVNTPKGARLYWLSKVYNDLTISYYKHFATFSNSQYTLLHERKKDKCDILSASFMLKDYGVATKERSNQLISFMTFGNIIEYKRIDVLIDAAQQAYEKTNIKFRVIIAGGCKKWERYESLIKYPDLFDLRISRVEDSEIPNLFEECDYFVAPYQDIAQSGSVIVAINYNKPIIASKIEAFEDFIEDKVNGFLIHPASVIDLREIIVFILNNHHNIYSSLQNNQRDMIKLRFKDEIIVKKYVDYFNKLLK